MFRGASRLRQIAETHNDPSSFEPDRPWSAQAGVLEDLAGGTYVPNVPIEKMAPPKLPEAPSVFKRTDAAGVRRGG